VKFQLPIRIANACDEALGDYRFKVRVRDVLGTNYDSTFVTDEAGLMEANVPPYDYEISVTGVTNPDAFAVTVLDFFKARSFATPEYSYESMHRSFFKEFDAPDYDSTFFRLLVEDIALGEKVLSFQQTPTIITDGFDPKCDNAEHLILDGAARESHTVRFYVRDNQCNVKKGKLLIVNTGALELATTSTTLDNFDLSTIDENDIIAYDSLNGAFEYTFTAAYPNMQAPYTQAVQVYYFNESESLLTSEIYEYIVTGERPIEGSD
ncbi:MAG: hypothetical protein AAFY41_19650, partial [Bacteroidota bacterium]